MAELLSWDRLLESGGPALIILLICSIISIVVIIERVVYFSTKSVNAPDLVRDLMERLNGSGGSLGLQDAEELRATPAGYVLTEIVEHGGKDLSDFDEVKGRAIAERLPDMERYLGVVATLGTVSPYIGLLGTVLGIIRAFLSLGGETADGGMGQLNAGIAEALIATAAGLFVAIPATVAYNYFRRRVNTMVLSAEVAASRLKAALNSDGRA